MQPPSFICSTTFLKRSPVVFVHLINSLTSKSFKVFKSSRVSPSNQTCRLFFHARISIKSASMSLMFLRSECDHVDLSAYCCSMPGCIIHTRRCNGDASRKKHGRRAGWGRLWLKAPWEATRRQTPKHVDRQEEKRVMKLHWLCGRHKEEATRCFPTLCFWVSIHHHVGLWLVKEAVIEYDSTMMREQNAGCLFFCFVLLTETH